MSTWRRSGSRAARRATHSGGIPRCAALARPRPFSSASSTRTCQHTSGASAFSSRNMMLLLRRGEAHSILSR